MTDLPGTVASERRRWTLVTVCVVAGGLSVRPDWLGTPLAAMGAGLVGSLALWVWEWSRLPALMDGPPEHDQAWRALEPLQWLALGLSVGLALLAVIRFVIEPAVPSIGMRIAEAGALPIWRRVIIIYVAAVIEELIFRLLLFSAIVGVANRLLQRTTLVPTPGIVWAANAVSALAFAVSHLPSWSSATTGSVILTLSVLALNTMAGLVIGCVFASRGIGPAMWTHAGGDCAIQLLGPLTT